ncbi:hypothetical protein JTE90_010660 [Oedothorax gibbosus]|uniref:Uncharacterized protein n=1 Tax=Oedothorax gibbosus TaxID=931172 RepID=A0AAV6UU37_9ARAC|nr:hypothetical protein JTE90_010660 [Oedothorax gibbosus]
MASFYANIISEIEKEIDKTELRKAAKDLSVYYKKSNKHRSSPPDYNNPAYCCAYLYKYATNHSRMTAKYFRKMCNKKEIKDILLRKKEIKICCLGGGPGIEIVGICKALAYSPSMHNKVRGVSVLDEFNGWESLFDSIMSSLADGKDEALPETFFGKSLRKEFLQVEFQYPLSKKSKEVVSQADIVCLTKHSPEFSKEKCACISQVLGKLFKKNALILYIDRSEKISLEDVDYISRSSNFKVVLGPLEGEKFENKFLKPNVKTYGCYPHIISNVSVIGWIKTSTESDAFYNESLSLSHSSLTDVESIGAESEIMDSNVSQGKAMDSDEESEIAHSDIGSEVVYSDIESEIVHSDIESEIVHSDIGSEIVHSDIGSEVVHSDIGSEFMHSDMEREIIQLNMVMESERNTDEAMDFDVKRKAAVDFSENINKSSKTSELVDYDIKLNEECNNMACNKYTQTEDSFYLSQNDRIRGKTEVELEELLEALAGLVTVLERFALTKKI